MKTNSLTNQEPWEKRWNELLEIIWSMAYQFQNVERAGPVWSSDIAKRLEVLRINNIETNRNKPWGGDDPEWIKELAHSSPIDRIYLNIEAGEAEQIHNDLKDFISKWLQQEKVELINLIECERDCIKSGNVLSPTEQDIALSVIDSIESRFGLSKQHKQT